MRACTNPALCGVKEHYDDTVSKCQNANQPRRSVPVGAPPSADSHPFSSDDLKRTQAGAGQELLLRRISDLKSQRFGALRHRSRIKCMTDDLQYCEREYGALKELNASNNRLHAENPDIPAWSHSGATSKAMPHIDMYKLYRELRDFDLVAERGIHRSPDEDVASEKLSNRLLGEQDRDVLREYYHANLYHDGKDHEADSAYWALHRRLDAVIAKLPTLEKPVVVWRGENYFPRGSWGGERERTLETIQRIATLQPGDKVTREQCAATSTRLRIAADSQFSTPIGKAGQPIRHNFDRLDPSTEPHYSVVFEMETDRGVFIDNDLHCMSQVDESEILLPMGMEYEVVGHAQIRMKDLGAENDSRSHHVIKLKLLS